MATLGERHLDTIASQGTHDRRSWESDAPAEAKPLLRRQLTILSDKKVRKKTPAKAIVSLTLCTYSSG